MIVIKSPELLEAESETLQDAAKELIKRFNDPVERALMDKMRRAFHAEHGHKIQAMLDKANES